MGATVWRNLRASRFTGPIHAVDPQHAMLDGGPCHARPEHPPTVPDLAVICTPPAAISHKSEVGGVELGHVLHENPAMRELARSAGFVLDGERTDADAVCLVLTLKSAS